MCDTSNDSSPVRDGFASGEVFGTMRELKLEVARYFAQRGLAFRLPVNNKRQLKVQCTEHSDCPFLVWAFLIRGTEQVKITTSVDEHSINFADLDSERQRAPNRVRGMLLVPVAQSVHQVAGVGVRSSQIVKKAKHDHRFDATLHQAWRSKQSVLALSREDGKQSYMFMEDWLRKMVEQNPGTASRFEAADGYFRRCGIVHGVFNKALQWMLPLVALDACHLKTKDKGIMYLASVLTGDFDILIAGVAISNCGGRENKEDWVWFLESLVEAMPSLLATEGLVVVSDRDKGLIPAVAEKIPNAKHSFCSFHIKRNVASKFHTSLDGLVHILARTVLQEDATQLLKDLSHTHPAIAEYLDGIAKENWVSAYFPVPRFGIVTSNAAESMNSFVNQERLSAHLAILVRITRKTNVRLTKLKSRYQGFRAEAICPRIFKALRNVMNSALGREVINYQGISEVKRLHKDEYRVVDIVKRSCGCKKWEEMQYPCEHGYAAILSRKKNVVTTWHSAAEGPSEMSAGLA